MHRTRKIILLVCGYLFLALGAVGIFLPVLPTTPFVLLASLCFSSASPRIHAWLLKNRFFGPYIESYRSGTGVSPHITRRATLFVWVGLGISAALMARLWSTIMFLCIGAGVTLHLRSLGKKKQSPAVIPETAIPEDIIE